MRQNTMKERIYAGQPAYGVSVMIPSAQVVEMVAGLGFDWVMIDCEHGTISLGERRGHGPRRRGQRDYPHRAPPHQGPRRGPACDGSGGDGRPGTPRQHGCRRPPGRGSGKVPSTWTAEDWLRGRARLAMDSVSL